MQQMCQIHVVSTYVPSCIPAPSAGSSHPSSLPSDPHGSSPRPPRPPPPESSPPLPPVTPPKLPACKPDNKAKSLRICLLLMRVLRLTLDLPLMVTGARAMCSERRLSLGGVVEHSVGSDTRAALVQSRAATAAH